jgi:hypothetical protein
VPSDVKADVAKGQAFLWDAAPTIHWMPPPTWARLEAWNR